MRPSVDNHYLRVLGRFAASPRPVPGWRRDWVNDGLQDACDAGLLTVEEAHLLAVAGRAAVLAPRRVRRPRAKVLDPLK